MGEGGVAQARIAHQQLPWTESPLIRYRVDQIRAIGNVLASLRDAGYMIFSGVLNSVRAVQYTGNHVARVQ